ncbi:hypothetical protein JCM33374_g6529 [Metschnikowia sp. JCM 33374]|nr:hypothetical protein JCM33374_g6529 [Metschnikowia sp. JCM 33374]
MTALGPASKKIGIRVETNSMERVRIFMVKSPKVSEVTLNNGLFSSLRIFFFGTTLNSPLEQVGTGNQWSAYQWSMEYLSLHGNKDCSPS